MEGSAACQGLLDELTERRDWGLARRSEADTGVSGEQANFLRRLQQAPPGIMEPVAEGGDRDVMARDGADLRGTIPGRRLRLTLTPSAPRPQSPTMRSSASRAAAAWASSTGHARSGSIASRGEDDPGRHMRRPGRSLSASRSNINRSMARAASGSEPAISSSSISPASIATCDGPLGAIQPNSVR